VLFFARPEQVAHARSTLDNGLPGDQDAEPQDRDLTLSTIIDLTGSLKFKPRPLTIEHNPFCAGFTFLPDGCLLVAGGDKKSDKYDRVPPGVREGRNSLRLFVPRGGATGTGEWQSIGRISDARWYPTCTLLPDGRVFLVGGYLDDMTVANNQNPTCETIPARAAGPQYLSLLVDAWPYDAYPFIYTLPSGEMFLFAKDRAHFLSRRWRWPQRAPALGQGS
jgi:hypothetical protein